MTCRIDRLSTGQAVVLRISGRITAVDLDVLRAALEADRVVAFDLTEVELVDRDAIALLAGAEESGIEVRQCPAYVREWISREQGRS
jgi:anti-anti-sigma regulatory factor